MGRQIRFYQTDADISVFRNFIKEQKLQIFYDDKNIELFDDISIWGEKCRFFIGNQQMKNKGTLIEYHIPYRSYNRSVPDCKIGISGGRFYLSNKSYDDIEAIKTYNLLKTYVKKNYLFSKDASCYFSLEFIEMYKTFKYHIVN